MVTYSSKRPDRARQTEARDKMRGHGVFALLAGMRVGKTKVVVDDWGEVSADYPDHLVLAPGGCYRPWTPAVLADVPDSLARDLETLTWDSGRAKTKSFKAELENFLAHRGRRVLVVNCEALSTVEAARGLCVEFLRQRPGQNQCTADESVWLKEEDSSRGRFAVNVLAPLAARRRIMTGLVVPRSPVDLFNQFKFLDWRILGHQTLSTFEARYVKKKRVCMIPSNKLYAMLKSKLELGRQLTQSELRVRVKVLMPDVDVNSLGSGELRQYLEMAADGGSSRDDAVAAIQALGGYVPTIPMVQGYLNVEELSRKIEPHSYRVRLEDCYDMPESDYSFRDVEWHPEQKKVYEALRANAIAELDAIGVEQGYVTATQVVTRMMRLHQILCGHVVDDQDRLVKDVPEYRTRELIELLRDYDGKAVVWCSYDHSVRKVVAALQEEFGAGSVARFWGGNVTTREAEEARFKTSGECRFEVGTPDAGRYGRDWSVADLTVYYSCKNNLDHRDQTEMRVKADGKARTCAYVDMRVPGTVEDRVYACLRQKMDVAAVIQGDDFRQWLV